MKPTTIMIFAAALAWSIWNGSPAAAGADVLAERGALRFDHDYTLHLPDGRTQKFEEGAAGVSLRFGAFSPDGRLLLYSYGNRRGSHDLKVYDIETGDTRTYENLFRKTESILSFDYGGEVYVMWMGEVGVNCCGISIFSAKSGRLLHGKYRWEFCEFLPDGSGFRYEDRNPWCPVDARLKEATFEELVSYDVLWIPEEEAQSMIAGRLEEVTAALATDDPARLADFVHPEKGLLVSTDAFVDRECDAELGLEADRVFSAEQIRSAAADTARYVVGYTDGSGCEIFMTLAECLHAYVMGDYGNADQVGVNRIVRRGNTTVNTFQAFPGSIVVEYHYEGNPKNPDFTWHSTRLVFERWDGRWWLSAVTTDHWTI